MWQWVLYEVVCELLESEDCYLHLYHPYNVLRMWLCSKWPVNVYDTIYRPLCYWVFGCWWFGWLEWMLGCLNWFASCWLMVVMGWKCCIGEWLYICSVMNCHWFWLFSNFLSRFLLDCYCRYRPLVSGFAGWLKLIVIKNPCKTGVLWICWNNLWARYWRLSGKCVIFGFFAADTATKQPKWLIRKCRSTAL